MRLDSRLVGSALTTALVAACTLITNADGLSGNGVTSSQRDSAPDDAVLEDDDAMAPDADSGGAEDSASADASHDSGSGSGPCGTRFVLAPVEAKAVDPTDGGTVAPTCNVQKLLTLDEAGAGLDQVFPNQVQGNLAGQSVSSCVGARFEQDLAEAVVVAKALAGACGGYPCINGCTAAGRYRVLVGSDLSTLSSVDIVSVGDAGYESYRTPVPQGARWVVVCRGVAPEIPDINVDVILGCVDDTQ